MLKAYVDYYEKTVELMDYELGILVNLYLRVARKQGFSPDIESAEELYENPYGLETVMYHVESFASEEPEFIEISYIFD